MPIVVHVNAQRVLVVLLVFANETRVLVCGFIQTTNSIYASLKEMNSIFVLVSTWWVFSFKVGKAHDPFETLRLESVRNSQVSLEGSQSWFKLE